MVQIPSLLKPCTTIWEGLEECLGFGEREKAFQIIQSHKGWLRGGNQSAMGDSGTGGLLQGRQMTQIVESQAEKFRLDQEESGEGLRSCKATLSMAVVIQAAIGGYEFLTSKGSKEWSHGHELGGYSCQALGKGLLGLPLLPKILDPMSVGFSLGPLFSTLQSSLPKGIAYGFQMFNQLYTLK